MNPRCYENENMDMNMNSDMMTANMGGCACPPVYECPQERVCERYIVHEVPQDYPFMSYGLMINKYKLKSYYEFDLYS